MSNPPVDVKIHNAFERIVQYCQSELNWRVILCNVSEADFECKTIRISKTHSNNVRLYILLHEVGHVLASLESDYDDRFLSENYDKRSKTYHATVLIDECVAWDKGLKLAKTLKLNFNRRQFDMTKARMLATYATWLSYGHKQ